MGKTKYKCTKEEYQAMELKKAELGTPPAIDFWDSSSNNNTEETEESAK